MSTLTEQVTTEIEQFLRLSGMSESTFGTLACSDKNLLRRLRSGRSITLRKADQIRAYIAAYRPAPRPLARGRRTEPLEAA